MTDRTSIGDRMKHQYEMRAQSHLPRRTYTVIRLDGKAFHTYTRGCEKPFDVTLSNDMQEAAIALCSEAQGAFIGYVQSDEASIVLADFATEQTDAWFDGNVQKITSVASSVFTAVFNARRGGRLAYFDARVFTIPDPTEVQNYLIWRQQDCVRNSISGLAQANFSPRQLHRVSTKQMQEMLWSEKGINWSDEPDVFKNGAVVKRLSDADGRSFWSSAAAPTFTVERPFVPAYDRLVQARPDHEGGRE